MKKINVAVIGFGMSGRQFHLPPLINNEKYQVLKVMTRSEVNQSDLKKLYKNVEIITSFDAAVNDENIDLIIIATSNDVHFEYTEKALLNNKHVVCEKPFVESYKDAKYLYDLAKEKGVLLKVFHNRKYDGDIMTAKKIVEEGLLGRIISFKTRFDRLRPEIGVNWRFRDTTMAGIFYDLAPHLVHHAIDLFGMPNAVYNELFFDRDNSLVDDHFELTMHYDNGFKAFLGAEMLERNPLPRIEIVGVNNTYAKYGFDNPDSVNFPLNETYQKPHLRSVLIDNNLNEINVPILLGAHYKFYENLAYEITNNITDSVDTKLALGVILVMEKAMESYKKKTLVGVPKL